MTDVERMEWQPLETAPKDGSKFIGAYILPGLTPWLAVWYWIDYGKLATDDCPGDWTTDQWECDDPPTHWMPLPNPPSDQASRDNEIRQ